MLLELLHSGLFAVAVVLMVPVAVVLVQVVVAVSPWRSRRVAASSGARLSRVAVLVPAHDEGSGIVATLDSIRAQMKTTDRLLVVADNCSDDTARVAASAGAEVVERHDTGRRGKGYALDFGIRHLEAAPPDVVLIVDADCILHPGSLDRLAEACMQTSRPVQALYLMHAPDGAGLKIRMAEFAWSVKNHARPLGYHRLGWPCQLMGTGMAFPWALIRTAPLASGHLVEDMQLGLDLAAAGAAPVFCPDASVTSAFPSNAVGIAAQRARWERGHVSVILSQGPRSLWRAITQRRLSLVAMVLDLCVPPLAMLAVLLMLQSAVDLLLFALSGRRGPLLLALAALAMMTVAIALAWRKFGRDIVSGRELASVPLYVLAKLPLYSRFFRSGASEWVRTQRDKPDK